jgi:hypothetical protein
MRIYQAGKPEYTFRVIRMRSEEYEILENSGSLERLTILY